ncbi:hypothetical protein Ocin01_04865 [Orchesella cincta]|uniref:Uncharacterized protein n=1 Tax=Orchesella cincta TaxID=48709 RepID=A0A1D2N986_ORCCI|nr:hypothetical protein Ocin01_04865 [Orchesella cincta]
MDVPTQSSDPPSTSQSNETPVDSTQTNTAVNSQPSNGMAGGSETSAESPQSSDIAANSQSSEAPAQTTSSSETLPISGSSEVSGETPQTSEVTGGSGTGINQEQEVSTSQPSDTTSQSSETPAVPPLTVSESNQASADSSQTSEGIVPSETIETPAVTSQSASDTQIATATNEAPTETSSSDVAVSSQTSETSSESTSSNSGTVSESQSQSSTTSDESTTVPQSSESPVEPLQTTEAPKNAEGSTDPTQANNNEVTESGNAAATPVDSTSNDIVPALTGEGQESGLTTADSTHTESQTGETSVEQGHSIETSAASQIPGATVESQTTTNNQANDADLPNTATAVENGASTPASDAVPETTATETSTVEDKTSTQPIESGVTEIPLVSSSPNTIAEPTSTSAATTQESTESTTEPFSSSTSSTSSPLIASNSSFDVVTNTRHHFESYDDLVAKLNQTFEKSYIEITQALSELLKNETVFTNRTASESTTLSPLTTPTTGRPTVTPKPEIIAQNSSDGETPLYPDSVDTSLSDLSAPSYSSQEPLEPEDESLFGTTTPKYNSDVFLRGETSPGCLMEDRESFKRNAYSTVYSMTDGKPTMLSFLERETCVGTLSKTGRRTVRSRGILLPQLPLRLKIEAGMYIQNRLYLFDSSPAQKVWSFTYENSTRIYSLKSHSVISVDAFLQVCDILSHPPNFRVKAIAQFSLTDPTCIVYDKMGTPLLSANPSEEAVSLVNAIRYLMEREFVSQINSIFSWLDDSFVKSVYLYGTNGELYELYRDATSHNLWPMGKYRLIPYEEFPIPNGMVSGNF